MAAPYYGQLIADRVTDKQNYINRIDSHATLPGYVAIFDAADVMLSKKEFSDPCGTVNAITGVATLTPSGAETAAVAGTAAYAVLASGDGVARHYLECITGLVAVEGKMALATLTVTAGVPMNYLDIAI